jgi:hypothetical protein
MPSSNAKMDDEAMSGYESRPAEAGAHQPKQSHTSQDRSNKGEVDILDGLTEALEQSEVSLPRKFGVDTMNGVTETLARTHISYRIRKREFKKRERASRKALTTSLPFAEKQELEELARQQTFDKDCTESREAQGTKQITSIDTIQSLRLRRLIGSRVGRSRAAACHPKAQAEGHSSAEGEQC